MLLVSYAELVPSTYTTGRLAQRALTALCCRLGVPHLLNQVLGTTWCRFWPTSNSLHSLFEYYALEARRTAYNTPVGPRPVEEKPAEEAKGTQSPRHWIIIYPF